MERVQKKLLNNINLTSQWIKKSREGEVVIKHQQVRAEKRSLMFVLENKINKQHVYRWSQEKNGSSLWLPEKKRISYFWKFV